MPKKNLLFVFADQWRRMAMGCAGQDPVFTPRMDAFAAQSMYCTDATSSFPLCSPHRASLFTGRWPQSTGMFTNCKPGLSVRLRDEEVCIGQVMKENGYRTLAIHPGERNSWQRDQAYPRLGFDDFKCADDLDVPVSEEHGYISDETSFDQIIWEYEHKAPGEKLFVFNVTIQNHGSYTVADYPAEVTLTDCPGRYPMAEQYLTLANKSDEAFQKLVEYFSACEEPTVIVMFGDHQPSVEQEFLDMAYGLTQDGMTMEQYMGKYRTPFVLWANYPLPETTIPDTSLNFLAQYLVRAAGIAPTTYGRYLWDLHQTIPALTFVGYTDAEGNAYSHLETNDFTALIRQYQAMQYNNLFGENQRRSDWFSNAPALA